MERRHRTGRGELSHDVGGGKTKVSGIPRALRRFAEELDERIAALDESLAVLRSERAADSADDEHDPEGVTLSAEWSRIAGIRADALRERADAEAALARVAAGTYGVCIDCGRGIPKPRLDARPTASRCVECAERAGR